MNKTLNIFIAIALFVPYCYLLDSRFPNIVAPIYSASIEWAFNDFAVESLQRVQKKADKDHLVEAIVKSTRTIQYTNGPLPANAPITASTLYGHVYVHMALVYAVLLLALPWRFTTIGLLPLLSIGVCIVSSTLDIPFVIMGAVQDLILFHLQPDQLKKEPVVIWMHMMNSGGRFVLAISLALLASKSLVSLHPIWAKLPPPLSSPIQSLKSQITRS